MPRSFTLTKSFQSFSNSTLYHVCNILPLSYDYLPAFLKKPASKNQCTYTCCDFNIPTETMNKIRYIRERWINSFDTKIDSLYFHIVHIDF